MRVKAYRERYGSAFPEIGEALINSVMPLCKDLAQWHLGLTDEAPPRRVHPRESRWLEGLSKGQLESTLNQMAKSQRFGALRDELENILIKRVRLSSMIEALFNRMVDVQAKWLRASAPIFCARLPQDSPDKLILNLFAIEWSLAVGIELKLRIFKCVEARISHPNDLSTDRMRAALVEWARAVLESQWETALKLFGVIEQQWILYDLEEATGTHSLFLDDEIERSAAALHQAMKWVILGRWGRAFFVLHHAVFPHGEPDDLEQFEPTSETNPLFAHTVLALEAIEQLCGLAKSPVVPEPIVAGDQIGGRKWSTEEVLGDGLWRAVDTSGMHVSIEELWPLAEGEWSSVTQNEALVLNSLNHQNIAAIQDWGIDPESGRWFLAHPYIYGTSLIDRIEEHGPLSEAQVRSFFLQVTEALKKAHKVDLYHKQLRPENLIFFTEGQIVVTRWGVHRHKIPGWRAGSDQSPWRRCFIAPEVWSRGAYSPQSDIYSLAMTIIYALNPDAFDLGSEWEDLVSYASKSDINSRPIWFKLESLPSAYRELIARATHFEADKRYQTIYEFSKALQDLKPLYDYRGEFGEREAMSLMEVVALILSKPNSHHRIWQAHLREWVNWEHVDEIDQLVKAALAQQEEAKRKQTEEEREQAELDLQEQEENAAEASTNRHRSPRRSLVKKSPLNKADLSSSQPTVKRKRSPINPYLKKSSIAQAPGTLHTISFEGIPLHFCYIPQGDFFMGTDSHKPTTLRIERPQHVVTINRPLLMSQTVITQGFYAALKGVNPSYFEDWNAPVEQITWREAAEFCNFLSRLDGLEEVYAFKNDEVEVESRAVDEDETDDLKSRMAYLRTQRDGDRHSVEPLQEEVQSLDDSEEEVQSLNDSEEEVQSLDDSEEEVQSLDDSEEEVQSLGDSVGDIQSLELSAEHEGAPELDEQRRQILNEGEAELEAKANKRYQIEKVDEPSHRITWVKCRLNIGGYRLPTEAEWEYSARSGVSTLYAGSNKCSEVAWGSNRSREGTQPVGELQPNSWGLYDMSGNVAEWCTDEQRIYTRNAIDPHQGVSEEWTLLDRRVIRGGGWRVPEIHARVSARSQYLTSQRRNHIGFRVVRPLLPINPFEGSSSPDVDA